MLASLLCTVATAVIMVTFQSISNNSVEKKLVDRLLTEIPAQLDAETEVRKALIRDYDKEFQKDLATAKYVMETGGTSKTFEKIVEEGVVTDFYFVDRDGKIVNATDESCIGRQLMEVCPVSSDEYRLMMEGEGYVNTEVHKTDDESLVKFYATEFEKGRLVMPAVLKGKYANVYLLDNMGGLFGAVDERLFVAPIYNETCKLGTFKTEAFDFSNQPISMMNLDESVTREPSSGHSNVMGYGFNYKTIQYKSDIWGDITIFASYTDTGAVPVEPLIILLATILLMAFLLQLYCQYIDEEPGKLQLKVGGLRNLGKKGCTIDTEKARILLPFSLISIVVVTVAGFYLNSLNMIANQCWTSRWNIIQATENLSEIEKRSLEDFNAETEDMAAFHRATASILEDCQNVLLVCRDESRMKKVREDGGLTHSVEICNPWLAGLAKAENASDISVFDGEGKLISTSGTQRNLRFSRNDSTSNAAFDVIDGVVEVRQFFTDEYFNIAVPFTLHKDGQSADAMLVARYKKDALQVNSVLESIAGTFNSASESGHCYYLMSSAQSDHKAIYVADILKGDVANIKDGAYAEDYCGFQKVKGERCFVATKRISGARGDYFILSFVPLKDVYLGRSMNTVITFVVTLLIMLILLGIVLIYGPDKTRRIKERAEREVEERKAMSPIQLERLDVEMKKMPTASQRILGTMRNIWIIILFLVTVVLFKGMMSNPAETLSGYLMSLSWQRSVNIFSITTMLIITLSFSFALFILSKLMSVLGNALNASTETVCQLLVSLLRYAGYITVVFITLYMFGVDTTGVLASLGAFSVMVGLGAKNLITDILAGISIIMENDYRVGDIVNIGGFCGKVSEIGIRTTKVEDIDGNVKIFYNSGVNGVINMTSRLSSVRMDIKLDAKHSFDHVEKEFKKFFERVSNKYPQIKGDCNYLGVQETTPSFNVFRIVIPCNEIDRAPLRRALTKEFSEFCKEEDITKL